MLRATRMRAESGRQTIAYLGGHVALGLMSAVLGPTLPALATRLGTEPEALGLLFVARSLGYAIASFVAGPIYDRRAAHPVLLGALLTIMASMAAVPLLGTRAALLVVMLVMGLAQGVLDVGNNMSLARVHESAVAPYMSALHCAYGVGALLAPLVVGASSTLAWSYWTLALAMLPAGVWLGITPSPARMPARSHEGSTSEQPEPAKPVTPTLVWLFAAWFLFCQGAEASFGGWIYTIATMTGFAEAEAARLVSLFWGAFTLGRLISIPAALRVRPQTLLMIDLLGALASGVLLVIVPGSAAMWIGTIALGLSLASLFPATMSLAGQQLRLDGGVTSKLFVGASLGSMLVPWLVGHTLVLGPSGPLWMVLGDLLLAGVLLAAIRTRLRQPA